MENREIKFRVWDKESEKFFGDMSTRLIFASSASQYNKFSPEFSIMEYYPFEGKLRLRVTKKPISDLIFQQFIGLKDKNGKEIYEGDILKNPNFKQIYDVRYNKNTASFELYEFYNEDYRLISMDIWKDKEVIGNIFENPELLK